MHPLWKSKRGLFLYLISWGVAGILLASMVMIRGELLWWEAAVLLIAPAILLGLMCLPTWYLCQAFPLERNSPSRVLLVFLAASMVTSALWVGLCIGWAYQLGATGGVGEGVPDRLMLETGQLYVAGNFLFLLAAAVHYILSASQKAGEAARQVSEHRALARDPVPLAPLLAETGASSAPLERLIIRDRAEVHVVPVETIDYLEAQDDYVAVHASGTTHLKQDRLAALAEKLDPRRFVRVHRSFVINVDRLARIELYARDSRILLLKDGTKIPLSREGYRRLKGLL